jgi:hypothetical protein
MSHRQRRRAYSRQHRTFGDQGQSALILVIGMVLLITTIGGVMVTNITNNDPILKQASIQRYAYRALASGLNAYQSAINGNPFLAACNSDTNVGASDAKASCSGISYGTWSVVPQTDVGNGVVPEFYKFDNPYAVVNSTTNALTYLDVEIVGAAGFGSNIVYYSTVAKFTPANGFLDNVWWSNYESYNANSDSNPATVSTSSGCSYYWATGYSNSGSCTPVYFANTDSITGPVFTNDSIFADSKPNFGANYSVTTADPHCLFVDPLDSHGTQSTCAAANTADVGTYDAATSSNSANNLESIPTDDSELGDFAQEDGCYYEGPTTITFVGNQMTVLSKGTSSSGALDSLNNSTDTSVCPTDGTTEEPLPANGVIFVQQGGTGNATTNPANPFDGITTSTTTTSHGHPSTIFTTIDSQTSAGGCTGCYYGQTANAETEGDAFVSGSVSGHVTVGSSQNIIIDGPLTYADCTGNWVGTPSQSNCPYNSFTSSTLTNDTLGLIAYQYVEVNMPVANSGGFGGGTTVLATCGTSGAEPAPLCDPSTASGDPAGGYGLTIDASILALQGSFIVNNYQTSNTTNTTTANNEGTLTVYGSIQQDARGAVGTFNGSSVTSGYTKAYLWDPRLPFYSPPYYLTPGTASWNLVSSAESYTGACPTVPPAQSFPATSQPTFNVSTWSSCSAP